MILAHLFLGSQFAAQGAFWLLVGRRCREGAALAEARVRGAGRRGPQEGVGGPGGCGDPSSVEGRGLGPTATCSQNSLPSGLALSVLKINQDPKSEN